MRRQHSAPCIANDDKVQHLQEVKGVFSEDWLQKFVFIHHHTIPINEIEPAFGPLIPVCRELPTGAGPIDVLFVNNNGLLTLVECKLWKNPEARREVVGQILDYAKEISQWSYADLENAIKQAQHVTQSTLYNLVSQNAEDVDERDFIDSISRNLRRGRFLLLIIGDGIRENVEQITDFLQKYAHLNFGFALVEFGVFRLPSQKEEYIVQSRLVTQTIEVERAVFRIEDNQIVSDAPIASESTHNRKRTKVSEQVFFEKLNIDATTKASLRSFLEKAQNVGLYVEPGQNSVKLKSSLYDINFGLFKTNGEFYNCGITSTTEEMGQPQIGEDYLRQLAELLDNGFVKPSDNRFWWTVRIKMKKGDRYATAAEVLGVQDKWLKVIQKTLDRISKLDVQ